jgi:membrane-associated phospholipid phosphatase
VRLVGTVLSFCIKVRKAYMYTNYMIWLISLLVIAGILTFLIADTPYFPGDREVTLFLQSLAPQDTTWAQWITKLATYPWYLVLVGLAFGLAWILHGSSAAILSLISFAGLLLVDKGLRLFVFRPRPSPELVHVDTALMGSSFPSTSALIYMATIGFVGVLAFKALRRGVLPVSSIVLSCIALILVFIARVTLGAHWPSDILISYLIGLIWILLLLGIF